MDFLKTFQAKQRVVASTLISKISSKLNLSSQPEVAAEIIQYTLSSFDEIESFISNSKFFKKKNPNENPNKILDEIFSSNTNKGRLPNYRNKMRRELLKIDQI
jgi:hypothetical protein